MGVQLNDYSKQVNFVLFRGWLNLPRSHSGVLFSLGGVWQGIYVPSSIWKPASNLICIRSMVPSRTQYRDPLQCQRFPSTRIVSIRDVFWDRFICVKSGNVRTALYVRSINSSAFAFSSRLWFNTEIKLCASVKRCSWGHGTHSKASKFANRFPSKVTCCKIWLTYDMSDNDTRWLFFKFNPFSL